MALRLLVFDMAGTTVAAAGDVARIFLETFDKHGIAVSPDAIAAVRGKSKKEAIRELVDQRPSRSGGRSSPEEIYRDFRERLIQATQGWRPISGVEDTFEWFRTRNVRVALTTGFDRVVLDALLEGLGWVEGVVDSALSAEEVPNGRPAPDLILGSMRLCGVDDSREVAVVGDTRADLLAAENAGAGWSIGVLSGAHATEELARCPHSAILDSVADLPAWFRSLPGAGFKN